MIFLVGSMHNRQRRLAISRAKIEKKCRRYKEVMEGFKAFQAQRSNEANPYNPVSEMTKYQAWRNGWCMAQDKQKEKDNE